MRTLLLADDSITIQRVIALTFAEQDFRVITVSDGQQAIDRMAAHRPDIVLAGTTMPTVDGYAVSRYVRSQPRLKNVPVLLLTGAFELVDEERLKASGASGTLEKPFEPTIVISKVKELLGIKGDARPTPSSGRLVTSADLSAAKRPPRPQAVTPKPELRAAPPPETPAESLNDFPDEDGLGADTRSVEGGDHEPARTDYLDSLHAAFDTLDARLSRRPGSDTAAPRNPDPPVRRSGGPADPRSPGQSPAPTPEPAERNSVFEVDDQWFADGDRVRAESRAEQRQLAAEMGIHDVDLPEAEPGLHAAPADGLDFDFGLEAAPPAADPIDVHEEMSTIAPASPREVSSVEVPSFEDLRESAPAVKAPVQLKPQLPVADAFAALLAHEQGEPHDHHAVHEAPAPVIVHAPPPEITDQMLDQIAERVADRLNGSLFADHLRAAMAATVRDTVRTVVSETSEKLVRDEIARVKAQAERDTQ